MHTVHSFTNQAPSCQTIGHLACAATDEIGFFSHGRAKSMQEKIQEDFSPNEGILDLDLAQLKISVAS